MHAATRDPSVFTRGAIRTRTVSRLSGATRRQLGYWHQTGLLEASVVSGSRGVPRFYSWIDYMKARAAVKLLRARLPNARLREYIDWLSREHPDWYSLPLVAHEGRVIVKPQSHPAHVADPSRQAVVPEWIDRTLAELVEEGPLGLYADFEDAVDMDPEVKGGVPVIIGTRIATADVHELVRREMGVSEIGSLYGLPEERVKRALEFETAERPLAA